ncbi:putative flavin-containing monoamine oxidase A [Styela clava]
MASVEKFDTVVIGGGIAGLYAAYLLQEKKDKKVILLEAKDRIGGRMDSAVLKCAGGTDTWDVGGQWVGRTQYNLIEVLKEFGLEMYDQYSSGIKKLMIHDPTNIRSYSGLIPTLGPLELLEIHYMMNKVSKMCKKIDLDNITTDPNAMELDSMTLHSFVTEKCRNEATREIFEVAIRMVFGVDLSQISMLYFLYYCKQGGGFETLLDIKNGAQEYRVKGSAYQLCEKIAGRLRHVVLGDPVQSIKQTELDGVTVITKQGKTYHCDNVIAAIPPHLVNHIDFSPQLPYDRIKLGEEMPVGHLIKFIVTYKTAFWKEKGMSGETTVTGAPGSIGPISCTFDGTSSNGNPAIVGFICADHAIYWTRKTMVERREAILQSLATMLGEECLDPIEYIDKDWAKESYNGGCPVGVMRPRGLMYFHHALRQPFGRVHWAGTETARLWCGYIEGGIESAIRAVSEITEQKPSSVHEWKESRVFSNDSKYISTFQSKSSYLWRFVTFMMPITAVCVLGWYVYKHMDEAYF